MATAVISRDPDLPLGLWTGDPTLAPIWAVHPGKGPFQDPSELSWGWQGRPHPYPDHRLGFAGQRPPWTPCEYRLPYAPHPSMWAPRSASAHRAGLGMAGVGLLGAWPDHSMPSALPFSGVHWSQATLSGSASLLGCHLLTSVFPFPRERQESAASQEGLASVVPR